ncbi:MAG: amidohydrolase family protein [Parvibaculum sp.]|uniref:amidohydrolase family protein n=1 Tax=Parvibaculum sp. TaxID=2024848 RepID=UPI0026010EE9|nr:amidohydrolase family protein [Parvibaculum sp.]MCE9648463.1 amidohydrolase family protein [Parvibaculum sp.]
MKVDAHQHFWRLSNGYYGWLTPDLAAIHRDFEPADLAPLLAATGIDLTVAVQAAADPRETEFLLNLAHGAPFIAGVVGWIDMETEAGLADLRRFARDPLFKGIRPMIQDIEPADWMLQPHLAPVFRALSDLGLSFDALVKPPHLDALLTLATRYPDLPIIVDHGAKPAIRDGRAGYDAWAEKIARLAARPNVACKLSGLLTEAKPGASLADLRPYLDHLHACFGAPRLMWGSDWPVLLLEGDYAGWNAIFGEWLASKPQNERADMEGGTAARLYRLKRI